MVGRSAGGVVPTQPIHLASSRLVAGEPACLLQLVMPSRRSWVVAWMMHRRPLLPSVAEPDPASHPCLLGGPEDPVGLVEVGSGSGREGQWAC